MKRPRKGMKLFCKNIIENYLATAIFGNNNLLPKLLPVRGKTRNIVVFSEAGTTKDFGSSSSILCLGSISSPHLSTIKRASSGGAISHFLANKRRLFCSKRPGRKKKNNSYLLPLWRLKLCKLKCKCLCAMRGVCHGNLAQMKHFMWESKSLQKSKWLNLGVGMHVPPRSPPKLEKVVRNQGIMS